ncbi:MAG: hypothetical protein PF689_10635 [Deltaproteobacteria bacterium]|nr:hypothetical protein [Deltaproteobacteria bacterium]
MTSILFYLFLSILFQFAGCGEISSQDNDFLSFQLFHIEEDKNRSNFLFSTEKRSRSRDTSVPGKGTGSDSDWQKKCFCSANTQKKRWNSCQTEKVLAQGRIENIIPAQLTGRTIKFYLYIALEDKHGFFPGNGSYLPGTMKAIFKVKHRGMDFTSPNAEIAAFKLARLLQFNQVPPAAFRRLSESYLLQLLKKMDLKKANKFKHDVYSGNNLITGAAVYYSDGFTNFESTRIYTDWLFKKKDTGLGVSRKKLAKQMGKVILFDFLTGNYDRFSGGNIMKHKTGRLLFIDHGAGFGAGREWKKQKAWELLRKLKKVSEEFVARISQLSNVKIKRCLKDTLSENQICEIINRKKKLLEYLNNKYKGSYY